MAKMTIVFRDDVEDGRPCVRMETKLDVDGASPNSPPTSALIAGHTVLRQWASGSLLALSRCICPDMVAVVERPPLGAVVKQVDPLTAKV